MVLFVFVFFFNLAFLGGAIIQKDVFVFGLDEITSIAPLTCSYWCFLYGITAMKGWHTAGEKANQHTVYWIIALFCSG
jgi:hypothetical protein